MDSSSDAGVDPRTLPKTPDGFRQAWFLVEETWSVTVDRAQRLPEASLHESVNGEWCFVETQRHLIFVTDAWIRRTILGESQPYHRLAIPPDHRIGVPDPAVDVTPWGIDVLAQAALDEVLDVRAERSRSVREIVEGLSDHDVRRTCDHNPAPGFPASTAIPVGFCLDVVIGEEWAHHGYATRDLDALESRC